jgi:hypothetical protein
MHKSPATMLADRRDRLRPMPGKEKESDWLMAPDGPICGLMPLHWPKSAALDGTWKPPAVQLVK